MILAMAAAFVVGSIATGTIGYADEDDDDATTLEAACLDAEEIELFFCQAIFALQQTIEELTFTQTDPTESVIEIQLAPAATAPPIVVTDDTGLNDVFTVFPDGSIQIGFETVRILPNGEAPGLIIRENNLVDKAVGRDKINDKAVGRGQIDDKAVGRGNLDDKAVGRGQIDDGAIGQAQFGDFLCANGQLLEWNSVSSLWECANDDDTIYTDADAIAAVGPHTADTDTTLSEAQVEGFITNGAIDLDAASTLGGAAISTPRVGAAQALHASHCVPAH